VEKYGGNEEEIVHGIHDIRTWGRKSTYFGIILAWVDHSWWGDLGSLESLWLKNARRRNKESNKHGML
jgi:hypothetical protein